MKRNPIFLKPNACLLPVFLILLVFLIFIALSISASAQNEIPAGMQKIIDYNRQSTSDFALKISFFIAFVAGMLGILSPCILPFLPAYFSYTFKEKRNITKMTLVFFLGFSAVFVALGAIAGFIGAQALSVVQRGWLAAMAGLFIIFLGFLAISGKGLSSFIPLPFIRFRHKPKNDAFGTFLLGISFSLGWTACLGPILAGILGIGAIMGNVAYSAALLFFYSLGNLVPLFILSIAYDRFNFSHNRFIQGRLFTVSIAEKKYQLHSTNIVSGILLIATGSVMLIYRGTGIINTFDIFGTRQYFYSSQRHLIEWSYANILGIALFIAFIMLLVWFLLAYKNNPDKNNKN